MKVLIKLLGSFLFFILLQPECIKAQCHIDDWTALKALYESTGGDNWNNNTDWQQTLGSIPATNCDLSLLYGIGLDEQGRVTCLEFDGDDDCLLDSNLGGNNLNGNIPPELGNLSNLTYLSLFSNELIGSIPPELGNLSNLESLYLSQNDLIGSIPSELGNLSNLIDLRINDNQLSGGIPPELGNLSNLEYLSLSFNQLSGGIPPELGNLSNLTYLYLYYNQLSGSIPSEFGNLNNLTNLRINDNQLSGYYASELNSLCDQLISSNIYQNNNFEVKWEAFCTWGDYAYEKVCDIDDWTALKALYESSNGDNWTIRKGWDVIIDNLNAPSPECNLRALYGVELDSLRVIKLGLHSNHLNGSIPQELGNLSNLEVLDLLSNELTGNIPHELGNLSNLKTLALASNQLGGCYDVNLQSLCTQIGTNAVADAFIIFENNFNATWEDFCTTNAGVCIPTNVYPGDLNHDGIVNNQDIGLSGLYKFEIGAPRTPEDQNTEWYAHLAEDWNRQHLNNEDIKHFDCNGDGAITDDDRQAVEDNMGEMWSTPEPVDPPDASDYQIVLHPVEEINNNLLRINVALESVNGGDLILQGGHFTVDYGMQNQNIINATMNFLSVTWLGARNINLLEHIQNQPSNQTIEIGFTRIDGMDATGSGVIGELILQLDNSAARNAQQNDCMLNLSINTIGMHDSQPNNQPVENRLLQINMCESTCENTWNINDETQFQNEYESTNLIETNGFLIIGDEQQVEYRSNRVCLQSGFKVKAGASFRAGYGSCE